MTRIDQLVDGRDEAGEGERLPVINPTSGQPVATLTEATPSQVHRTVAAAGAAFETGVWSQAPVQQRQSVLRAAANAIRANVDELATLQVTEGGMTRDAVARHIAGAAGWFDYYADFLTLEQGESYRQLGDAITLVERVPIGVCALFTPWNVPLGLSAIKMAPALAAGNSVVLKPSEETPMVTRCLVDLVNGAGLPPGVLSYVNGRGSVTGAALAEAPGVDMVSFTGGHAGGTAVALAAARRHLPCVMELGGKSATIVFDDADLDTAVAGAFAAAYSNNGEACLAGSRILLQDGIRDAFLDRFTARAKALRPGDPMKPGIGLGPMVSAAHQARVLGFYDSAAADGDQVLFGGDDPGCGPGFFVTPGAIAVASPRSRIWREEVFGPLVAIARFSDEAEALALANDSEFGLSGYLFTRDLGRALRVTRRMRTGTVIVNDGFRRELNAPFGGFRQSGVGREGGLHSWMNFTEARTIVLPEGQPSC